MAGDVMLDGFGLAPVCVELDLDSYEGDWRHVERFRGRSGWLTVVEAQLRTRRHEWNTTLVAACDEFGSAVPSFMAPNLLACACSLPEPCSGYPPEVLDHIIAAEKAELKRRWVREHNKSLRALTAETARSVEMLEAEAKHRIALRDSGIAELRRRRRMPTATHEQRAILTELIEELENEQEVITKTLERARAELREMVHEKEREILARTEIRVALEPLYYVSWHGSSSVNGLATELGSLVRTLSRESSYLVPSARRRRDESGGLEASDRSPSMKPQPPDWSDAIAQLKLSHEAISKANGGRPSNARERHARTRQSPQSKSPDPVRTRRAAADLWLQSNRLLRKVRSWSDHDIQRAKWLGNRFNELQDDVERLLAGLDGAPPPRALHDASENLKIAAELFASRGLEFTNDL